MSTQELTVCIIDDDLSVRRALARLLKSARYRVETFQSAAEFLQRRIEGPWCVLLDVRMQGVTGVDLYQWLKKAKLDIWVILITGHAAGDVRALVGDCLTVDVLMKPFSEEMLIAAIERVIGRTGYLDGRIVTG